MKQVSLFLIIFLFPLLFFAQNNLDQQIEESVKKNNIEQLNKCFDPLYSTSIDTFANYIEKLIKLGEDYKSPEVITYATLAKSYLYFRKNDYVNMQNHILKANHLLDEHPNHFLQGVSYQFICYLQPTDNLYLYYCKKAVKEFQKVNKKSSLADEEYVTYTNMAKLFIKQNQPDSALFYNKKAENIITSKHKSREYFVMLNAAYSQIYLKKGRLGLAKHYAFKTLQGANEVKTVQADEEAWFAFAEYYDKTDKMDSALVYYKKLYGSVGEGWYKNKVFATGWLYHYYLKKKDVANTLKFGKEHIAGIEKIQKLEALSQVTKMNLLEKQREDEKEQLLKQEKEERANNLQLVLIFIGILTCFILYLILSRSFIVNHKIIEVLGVVVMLIFFEFINLLLHGFIARFTHHSSILMLFSLVTIASVIVPLHHRLEKWTTKKLIEKNKKIRMAKEI